jgi:hypothetical protein
LFTFVVMADTHVNQSEERSASPYPSTLLTNARARWAVHAINQFAPDFVIHLGDLTNPVPSLPTYPDAVARFRDLIAPLQCPIYFVAGNHDIGDKPVEWMPAKAVNDTYIEHYERSFGRTFYAFEHKDCRFVIANTPVINSGLPREAEQRAWLEAELGKPTRERTFFFTHYPVFLTTPDEPSHYDNVDEPGRRWLLDLLEQAGVEAMFTAHVHNFFYNRHATTDCYTVPAVAFVRHDYAEFFRADAAPEFARNDPAKLGFFVVRVYAKGHTVHLVRSGGATLAANATPPTAHPRLFAPHPRQTAPAPLGVHLRHAWAETSAIPATGGADEFARKMARNDYPLLSLWEMGVRQLRVPLQDLLDDTTRARLQLLRSMGHKFTIYSFGAPAEALRATLIRHADLLDSFELILDWRDLDAALESIRQIQRTATFPVVLSRLRGKDDEAATGGFYFHNIRHGFRPGDAELADPRLVQAAHEGTITGLAFHLPRTEMPVDALAAIHQAARPLGLHATGELRMVSDNPAEAFVDDLANANRIAEAMVTAHTLEGVTIFVDSLIDVDRGYFARTALYDRRYAPRLAGNVVRHLAALLGEMPTPLATSGATEESGARFLRLRQDKKPSLLVLPQGETTVVMLPAAIVVNGEQGTCRAIRLDSGAETHCTWQHTPQGTRLDAPLPCAVPTLITMSGR